MARVKRAALKSNTSSKLRSTQTVDKDAAIAPLIHGIGLLMAHAQSNRLGTAARILCSAKEDLVHWAVDMNFHESAKDQFVDRHLFVPGPMSASQLHAQLDALDAELRAALLDQFYATLPTAAAPAKKP